MGLLNFFNRGKKQVKYVQQVNLVNVSISALITAVPPFIKKPALKFNENMFQFLARNFPDEWSVFLERIKELPTTSKETFELLKQIKTTELKDLDLKNKLEHWANHKTPTIGRTINCLNSLKTTLTKTPFCNSGINLIQILWPREKHPSGDTKWEEWAISRGVDVVSLETGINLNLNLKTFFNKIIGEYLWLVPGGARFTAPLIADSLERILKYLHSNPKVAVYQDPLSSIIYKTHALNDLLNKRNSIPADPKICGEHLKQIGYSLSGDRNKEFILCDFESIYL